MLSAVFAQAEATFWPTSAVGWFGLAVPLAAILAGGWAGVRAIVRAIDRIAEIPIHAEQIGDLGDKADALDRGQVAILGKLDEVHAGMVTAAEMTTHTHQDAAMFDTLTGQLGDIKGQVGAIDGRLARVEEHVGVERTDPEAR